MKLNSKNPFLNEGAHPVIFEVTKGGSGKCSALWQMAQMQAIKGKQG